MAYTTIDNPELYFQCKLYTGNGSTQTITYDNTDADLDADMIWLKSRSDAYSHQLFDTVRGATELLNPEATDAEQTLSGVTAFATDTFAIGSDAGTNGSSKTYVAWAWKETATAGFDIVAYTGDGAEDDSMWDDTAPTSSVFRVKSSSSVNGDGVSYIAYLFAEKQGFSKFGSYTGNANNDGPYIHLGFKPAFLVIKQTNSARNWIMMDAKRSPFNIVTKYMKGNSNSAEETYNYVDFLSGGFKCRDSDTGANASGGTYIYYAFAENPFVTSTGVPATAR